MPDTSTGAWAGLRREDILFGQSRSQKPQLSSNAGHSGALDKAGKWFLLSGIQNPQGGVARYFDAATGRNRAVSTEITGYAASAFAYLFAATGEEKYLNRARKTALFLIEDAWDQALRTFPFEHPSPSELIEHHAYFFDCGIIIRGLLAVWQFTREDRLLEIASAAAKAMVQDFHSGRDYHPILALPGKDAVDRDERWSRSAGCYQLKAASSWWEVARITGDATLRNAFEGMLATALHGHKQFLPGTEDTHRVMDRLHAYCYFLEGLSVVSEREECREAYRDGVGTVERYLRQIAPSFARTDVYAQLLRTRLNGHMLGACPMDLTAATEEGTALAAFQLSDPDIRIDGGFAFGQRNGSLVLHVNPWASAFALQALDMWQRFQSGTLKPCVGLLI